jgi:hypothetical protein
VHTLVYIRRSENFNNTVLHYAEKNLSTTQLTTISEYFNGDIRLDMNDKHLDYSWKTQQVLDKELDLAEIIFRDRLLRNTPFEKALVLVRRAAGRLLKVFEDGDFDALVTYPVDNYIMDIMVQLAKKNNIPCYGVCNFFMANYKRLTVYGEHNPQRFPETIEVDNVLKRLQNNFHSHMAPSRGKAFKAAVVRYIKYKARFPLFYLLGHKVLMRNEYDLMCTPYITTVRNISNFFVERHFTETNRIDFKKKTILVPLHYFPEATIEYWCGRLSQVEFEDMLHCEINQLSERYEQIILKEHPASVYDNSSSFYRRLLENPKVLLVDPFVSTSKLLEDVNVLGCWTGTAGIEALVNGKQVEFFTDESYYQKAMNLHPEIIQRNNKALSITNPHVFIEEILKGCVPIDK